MITSRSKIRRLSSEFIRDISQDGAKKCIIPGKWLLQSLLVWPDTDNKYVTAFNWMCFVNLVVVEIFHASYVVAYRTDIGNAIIAAATVTTTFECLVRFYIIVFNKPIINNILSKIWRDFWCLSALKQEKIKKLTRKCYITLALTVGCYGPAIICNTIITLWPYLTHNGLVLKSVFPFRWNQTYVYETIYCWQYFTEWYILILVNTFDFFMIPVVMVCAVQFAVLQDVFENILNDDSKYQRMMLFGEVISDRDMVLKCLDQQRMLIGICVQLEEVFRFAILFQFVNSTAALCSSSVVLQVDSSQFMEMLTFATAHMFQLFYYCFVGNELTAQSSSMANAIYNCNWHLSNDNEFKKSLILMLQRSQKGQRMTAAGVIDLNFLSYISVLQLIFVVINSVFKSNQTMNKQQIDPSLKPKRFDMSSKRNGVRRLSLEFNRDMYEDGVKKCLLPAKILLQGVGCWPDTDLWYMELLGWFLFWNLFITEIFHAAYVLKNFRNIGDAVSAGATVTTTMEALVRLYIMLTKRELINTILVKIWKQFWPVSALEPIKRKQIKKKAQTAVGLTTFFFICAIISNSQITGMPYVRYHDMLLKSVFPFDWNQLYVYEILYVWQYYSDWYVLFMITAFDFFFVAVVAICSLQFVIIQEVLRSILSDESETHRNVIFGYRIRDKEMVSECLEQHKLLIGICNELENSFNIAILIQFFVSTSAICAASLVMKVDYSQFWKMLMYAAGHVAQLFYYCYVGHELAFESGYLSNAIYDCNWHSSYDRNFRKALMLMMQRSQKVQLLTAAGVTGLDFSSFLKIMRLSFSFYTLLNNLLMKNNQ